MTFLAEPYPERFVYLNFLDPNKPMPKLSVGVQVVCETPSGLKITPTKEVVFSIGTTEEEEQKKFSISPNSARELANRLVEFADAC